MKIQSNLEKTLRARELSQNLSDLPDDLVEELKDSFIEEHEAREKRKKEYEAKDTLRLNGPSKEYPKSDNIVDNNKRIILDDIPIVDQRTQVAVEIYAKEHELIARTHMKMAHDARIKGYFPRDLKEQQELILAVKAWNNYLEPIYHDKYSIDWLALFNEIAEQYRKDNNWPEDREFVREKRWKIFDDGTLENQFPYTEDHILGDTIVTRINKIIQISDCFPFMKKVWENNRKTRMTEQMKRNKKKFGKEVKDKNNQQSSLQNIKKKERVIDPDDYDKDLIDEIHRGDPVRNPPTPVSVRNMEEYDAIPEAYRLGFMRKSEPNNYDEYWRALHAYWDVKRK